MSQLSEHPFGPWVGVGEEWLFWESHEVHACLQVSELCNVLAGLFRLSSRKLGTCYVRWQLRRSLEPVCKIQAPHHPDHFPRPIWNLIPSFPWNAALSSVLQRGRAQIQMVKPQGTLLHQRASKCCGPEVSSIQMCKIHTSSSWLWSAQHCVS